MPGAATYDHRAIFYRMAAVQGASGVEIRTPTEIGKTWANVRYGTSSERRTAAGTEAGQVFTVRVRVSDVTRYVLVTDRVTVRNPITGLWLTGEIGSMPIPVGGGDIEFTVTAALGAGA